LWIRTCQLGVIRDSAVGADSLFASWRWYGSHAKKSPP
jgi:hypothetical protein